MADNKKLDSVIQIDGESYEVQAESAKKVEKSLIITKADGTTETFDGSAERTISIPNADNFVQSVKIGSTEYKSGTTVTLPAYPTKSSLGLSNVTNDAQVKASEKGVANGVATLNELGKVPAEQLPSYVDDVLEYASYNNFPQNAQNGAQASKIYVALDTNKTYRWSGSTYIEIGGGVASVIETTLTIVNKTQTNTNDLAYVVTNLEEDPSNQKGHYVTPTYIGVPTKKYVDDKAANLISHGTEDPTESTTSQYYFKY